MGALRHCPDCLLWTGTPQQAAFHYSFCHKDGWNPIPKFELYHDGHRKSWGVAELMALARESGVFGTEDDQALRIHACSQKAYEDARYQMSDEEYEKWVRNREVLCM